ncbi:MAG: hypothetical protein JJU00_02645 [Opitutales bacterium]|nr:hypothetical protein [Opitutales bacterium]
MNAPSQTASVLDTVAATLAAAGPEPSSPVLRDVRTRIVEAQSAEATRRMSTAEVRGAYLCEDLVAEDAVSLVYWEVDRAVVGAARPGGGPRVGGTPPRRRGGLVFVGRGLGGGPHRGPGGGGRPRR